MTGQFARGFSKLDQEMWQNRVSGKQSEESRHLKRARDLKTLFKRTGHFWQKGQPVSDREILFLSRRNSAAYGVNHPSRRGRPGQMHLPILILL